MNGYQLYFKLENAILKAKDKEMKPAVRMHEIAVSWKALGGEGKQVYKERAKGTEGVRLSK